MTWCLVFFAALAFLWLRQRSRRTAQLRSGSGNRPEARTNVRRRDIRDNASLVEAESMPLQPEVAVGASGRDSAGPGGPTPQRVSESVSVVLRRQIPPRDEAPRSWLGGLPMMPDCAEWPRGVNPEKADEGEVPLHFIVQICCADLPAELWGGLGPRAGWLRLFHNGNSCDCEDNGLWRFVYTEELGVERQLPAGIGVIHDGVYTGGSAWTKNRNSYPGWPIDLISVANTLRHEGQRSWPTPDDFESVLYPDFEVQRDRHRLPKLPPFSRRVLRDGLRAALSQFSKPMPESAVAENRVRMFSLPSNFALARTEPMQRELRAIEILAKRTAEASDVEAVQPDELAELIANTPHILSLRADRFASEMMFEKHCTPEAVIGEIEADHRAWIAWRQEVAHWLEEWLQGLQGDQLDCALNAEDLGRLHLLAGAPPSVRWEMRSEGGTSGNPGYLGLSRVEETVGNLHFGRSAASDQNELLEYYLDPARRKLLPAKYLPAFEAYWRSLYSNRPHRIGGYHDGVQSDAVEGPQERLLLIQLATDDAMQFCWGDAGAIYAMIKPADLAAGRFNDANLWLECH